MPSYQDMKMAISLIGTVKGAKMKKLLKNITIMIFSLILAVSCRGQKEKTAVYTFYGEDDYIEINNGIIVVSLEEEIFFGGTLEVNDKYINDIKFFAVSYYVNSREKLISVNTVSDETGGTLNIQSEMCKVVSDKSGKDKFSEFDWLKDPSNKLYFELETVNLNDEKNQYRLPLIIKEITNTR